MKQLLTAFGLTAVLNLTAQTFNGATGGIQNNGVETYFNCGVSGLTKANLDSTFGLEEVCVTISHPKVEEIFIYLISPSGRTVEITEGTSCSGTDYSGTCFNSNANTSITNTVAPYTGTFRPTGYLGRFNDGQPGNGTWKLVVKDYLAFVNSGSLVSWSLRFSNTPPKPVILSSTNLPIVIINTNNQVFSDTKQIMDFAIIYNGPGQRNHPGDPRNDYNGKAAIHIRGNTTKNFEKKALSVELRDNHNLKIDYPVLGMPAESDWDLIAEYQDKTLMRIPLAYMLARKMGRYAPRVKNVEVIINGEYSGVYALVEKIKRSDFRLDIKKLYPTDNAPPYITGGYLMHIDRTDAPGWFSYMPGNSQNGSHFFYQYDEPKDSLITDQQRAYIKNYMNDFETLMASTNFADPVNGYSKYLDVGTAVDMVVLNEMSKNVDGYRLSAYLYKQDDARGGKLCMGPAWDYDLAWHNCNYGNTTDPSGWEYELQDTAHPAPIWWSKWMSDPSFQNAFSCRWQSLRWTLLNNNSLYSYIDSSATALQEAQQRNFRQWPILGTYIYPNPQSQPNANYQSEVADLKSWINNRFGWIDGQMKQMTCSTLGLAENSLSYRAISVYPNPLDEEGILKLSLSKDAGVSLTVRDALGKTVASFPEERRHAGENSFVLDKKNFAPGVYTCQVVLDGVVYSDKLVVTR